ncbi:MAG: cupin domain-containing protein [Ginsengibacter sp.]
MEVKYNDPTDLRPEGKRILDAPLVRMNIPEFIDQLKSEQPWKTGDKNAMTIYKNDSMRIVLIALHKDAVLKKHTAEGNISVQVIEGEIKFNTDADSVTLEKGGMVSLHNGLAHSVEAVKESVFLLTLAIQK